MAAIASLRNLPLMADSGLHMFFLYGFAALAFFIPSALVSAELATIFHEKDGGLYQWVSAAMGKNWGFLSVWFLTAKGITYFPTVLAFIGGTAAFLFDPKLAENPIYTISIVLGVFWAGTLINFKGLKLSHFISSMGSLLGTLIPSFFIIGLGIYWVASGNRLELSFATSSYVPDLGNWHQLAFLAGTFVSFAGMELSAVNVNHTHNPQKTYPKAIFISSILILMCAILGSLSIALVVPHEGISLDAGLMQAFDNIFSAFGLGFLTKIAAIFVLFGAIATLKTWIISPPLGLLETAKEGILPTFFQKVNKHGIPTNILLVQAIIVSAFSGVFMLLPSVNSSFYLLTAITADLYMMVFLVLFPAAIILRFKRPDLKRTFKVPGGKLGMLVIGGSGFVSTLFAFCLGFVSPPNIEMGSVLILKTIHVGSILLVILPPLFFIYRHKRKLAKASLSNGMDAVSKHAEELAEV